MILVADSGSTKADWIFADQNSSMKKMSSVGFNPYFHDEAFVLKALKENNELSEISDKVRNIYFYGAGCSSPERNELIRNSLSKFFVHAEIVVDNDLYPSAIATCGDKPGIACILGTGSNSCYYDGKKIVKNNYGLGFIMGDEGGGTYFGKKLITHYLYDILPHSTRKKFEESYQMSKEIMISNVYNNKGANVWLASFAKFLTENKNDEWVRKTVTIGMEEFFDLYVCGYKDYKNIDVHFVGSVAYYFEDILRETGLKKQAQVKNIIRHPITTLAEYYISKIRNK